MKRLLALLLAVAMIMSLVSTSAFAAESGDGSGSGSSSVEERDDGASSSDSAPGRGDGSASLSSTDPKPEPKPDPEPEPEPEPEKSEAQEAPEAEDDKRENPAPAPLKPEKPDTSPEEKEEKKAADKTAEEKNEKQKTLKKTLKTADGVSYTVSVSYGEDAEIPDDAELSVIELVQELTDEEKKLPENEKRPTKTEKFVSEEALEQEKFDLVQGLKVREKDYVLFARVMDLSLKADGKEIQPKAPVTVRIETDEVKEGASDALKAALYDEKATEKWQKKLKKRHAEWSKKLAAAEAYLPEELFQNPREDERLPRKIYRSVRMDNETKEKKGVKVSFETKELSRMGLAGIIRRVKSWSVRGETVTVYAPRGRKAKVHTESMKDPEAGLKKVRAFSVSLNEKKKDLPDYDVSFWVLTRPEEGLKEQSESSDTGVVARKLKNGKAKKELISAQGTDVPVEFSAGEQVGLLWDTGLRTQSVQTENVTVNGLLPKGAALEAEDVLWRYSRPEEVNQDAGEDAETLAAYDLSINNAAFQSEDAMSISIQSEGISERKRLEVWQLQDDETVEILKDTEVKGDTISFQAAETAVYMVVQVTKEQVITAGDGKSYKVTVTYDSDAVIPDDAELSVSELNSKGADYQKYVKKTAKKLGVSADSFAFARAFDIALVNPETGEHYQPRKSLKVRVRLLDEKPGDDVDVVHFGKKTEVLESSVSGKSVEFETNGFSVYVLTGEKDTQCTYYFYSYNDFGEYQACIFYDEQGNQVSSQTIKNGETLIAPTNPPRHPNHRKEFKGWYKGSSESNLESSPFDFTKPQAYTPGNQETSVNLYAVFADYAYVNFHGQYDSETQSYPILESKRVELNNNSGIVDISDVSTSYYDTADQTGFPAFVFYGWSQEKIKTADDGHLKKIDDSSLTVTGDTDLYPLFQKVNWLSFVSGNSGSGAKYYAPVSIVAGSTLLESEFKAHYIPTRLGYTFQGWYLSQNCETGTRLTDENGTFLALQDNEKGIQSVSGPGAYLQLSNNVTLYADWAPAQTDYTIVVWRQRSTDAAGLPDDQKKYDYAESFKLNGTPNTPVQVAADYQSLNTATNYNSVHPGIAPQITNETNPYKGYTLNQLASGIIDNNNQSLAGQTIQPDGSTVFNLYYDKDNTVTPGTGTVSLTFQFVDPADGPDTTVSNLTVGSQLNAEGITPPAPERTSMPGYTFGWYYDPGCTSPVKLNADTIPDHDLTVYGGWTKEWYLIKIDPNYGDLHGQGSTYFWKTYQSDYIQEYTWVTRNYMASESGSYYYVNHDYDYCQANPGSDRLTSYTENVASATDLQTFRSAPGVYLYDGWYQVHDDGTETRYEFGHPIEGNTTLRLHWKLAETYYLQYNADVTVDGKRLTGEISDNSTEPGADGYADQSEIILNSYADAPDGYTFIGWQVRGDDSGKIYHPGDLFTLNGELAVTVNGKKIVYLDAVYTTIQTACIVYDANGGTVSETADSGYPYQIRNTGSPVLDEKNKPVNLNTHTVTRTAGTVTVSGLVNNSAILLSSGKGFTPPADSGATLSGWNTKPDGTGTHYRLGSYQDENEKPYYVDIKEPVKLYAEWKITVYFDKNTAQYPGAEFSDSGWERYNRISVSADSHSGQYATDTNVHALLKEPEGVVTAEGQNFDFWSTSSGGAEENAFDFAKKKLTGSLTLYAHLADMVKVPYQVVSSNRVERNEWKNTDTLRVSATEIDLTDPASVGAYVTPEVGYTYGYACLSDSPEHISTNTDLKITSLYLDGENGKKVTVKLANNSTVVLNEGKDGKGNQIYLVYATENEDKRIKLAYVKEIKSGSLSTIDPVRYNAAPFTSLNASLVSSNLLNSTTAGNGAIAGDDVTGQVLTLNGTALEISQRTASGVFNAPPLLDDDDPAESDRLTLVYDYFGVGAPAAANVNDVAGKEKKLFLRYYDGRRQWSLDGIEWKMLTGDTLYVVYRQRGRELHITKSVTGENTGISPDASFEVTVTSSAITRTSYKAEGTGHADVAATPATETTPGSISLTVKDGSDIRIQGLAKGSYTVTEKYNINFTLTAKVNNAPANVTVSGVTGSVEFLVNSDTTVELRNTPYEICRVRDDATLSYQNFYTLNKALDYIQDKLDGAGSIELLRDYVMPDWDALEIPSGYSITLTSKPGNTGFYTIRRDEGFTTGTMFTNYGSLALNSITLDGNRDKNVKSKSSMVHNSGALTVSADAKLQNADKNGAGAAIDQKEGSLTVENNAEFRNNSSSMEGGAIIVRSGTVRITGGTFTGNTAKNGGAVCYSGTDTVTISGGTFTGNTAAENGGTIYARSCSITVSGGTFTGDYGTDPEAVSAQNGGAIYAENASLTLSGGTFTGIRAQQNGGAVYTGEDILTLSGASFTNNFAVSGNGGAVCSASGDISITAGTFTGNSASNGNGGAVWLGSGTLEMSGGTIGGTVAANANSAKNGAGLFVDTGTANLSGGSITGNIATEGGAVGVGSADARLSFSGGVKVKDNKMGGANCNVYLNQDSDDVITITGLTNAAEVGVYVSDDRMDKRGVPGAKFASYTSDSNKNKVKNDRNDFAVVSETASKKLYWGKAISIIVRYQTKSFMSNGFPPNDTGQQDKKTINPYYPIMGEDGYVALSAVAEDLYKNQSLGLSTTAAYAGAYIKNVTTQFEDYLTKLSWDKANSKWVVTKHNDTTTIDLPNDSNKPLVIYYAEPAYLNIENNTEMPLNISDIVMGTDPNAKTVVNTDSVAGYGMTFAKNGAIRSALLPVTATDLQLASGASVTLLIPGGRDTDYALTGSFTTSEAKTVRLRTTKSNGTGLDEETLSVSADGKFTYPTGKKTLNKAGTYQIIFGDDKTICKIRTDTISAMNTEEAVANGAIVGAAADGTTGKTEYLFASLTQAMAFVQANMENEPYNKTATIEMLTDYLLSASDSLAVPTGYHITLTTAATTGVNTYTPSTAGESRATISRDQLNTNPMLTAKGNPDTPSGTTFTVRDLIIDGKSVVGKSDGGAVYAEYCGMTVNNVKFLNIYANNGGAIFVDARAEKVKDDVYKLKANTYLHVNDCDFNNCYSLKSGGRNGGGAIHAFVAELNLTDSRFTSCEAVHQAGAVFHRVDTNDVDTSSTVSGCTFTSCKSKAAGGLELDSRKIHVSGSTFEHCVATDRNGGGFNVYALNSADPTVDCWTTVIDCSFDDCHVTGTNPGNGGGFRSNSKYTTIINTTFNNTSAKMGGAVGLSSTNAEKAEIYGCSINDARSTVNGGYGGGVYSMAKEFTIGDGYYYLDSENKPVTVLKDGDSYTDLSGIAIADEATLGAIQSRHTKITNCRSVGKGGGIYHCRDVDNSSLSVTNAVISGNTSTGNEGGGIAVYRVRSTSFTGCTISDNTAKRQGGGIWVGDNDNRNRKMVIDSSTIQNNTSYELGGGVYSYAQLTLRNNTSITGNRITVTPENAWKNAGGVFLPDGYSLTVGTAGASGLDSTTVKDNTNGSGAPSDLRLWWDNNKNSKAESVAVLCGLDGEIRVVNPGKAMQQFGSRTEETFAGFTEGKHVFVADSGGLYGVLDRGAPLKLIWRGGIVCKMTNAAGHLLYLDPECKDPAVFDRLDYHDIKNKVDKANGSKLSPFSYLRQTEPKLYLPGQEDPLNLSTEPIQVKMLVSTFETETYIDTGSEISPKLVTLTTAKSTETDGYPYTGRAGTSATIKRAYTNNNNNKPLLSTSFNMNLKEITLDGGSTDKTSPKISTANGGLIYANKSGITVQLLDKAILQNCKISNSNSGGGVYVKGGASLNINGGAIYNCSTETGNGGGVWKSDSGTITFTSGNISHCSAKNGGGVYFDNGTSFDMSGSARITDCTATEKGGGVYLNKQRTMNLSGGAITGNHAGKDGGGIYLGDHKDTRLKLSGHVTVSGNTADKDEEENGTSQTVPCNVELKTDYNDIICSTGKGIAMNSYIGIYVPGKESPGEHPADKNKTQYDKHGLETKPFGKFDDINHTNYLYCFINDRNGLKGGLQLGDNEKIHWVKIFSLQVSKTVLSGLEEDLEEEFMFCVTFTTQNGLRIHNLNTHFTYDDGRLDDNGQPKTIPIQAGRAEFTLKTGDSVTVDYLPAQIDGNRVHYKVEEILGSNRGAHYTTTTYRSSGTSGDHSVSGTIGENLYREDVTSKYTSYAHFDNLNAVCKLTSSKNSGVLLYTLDAQSEKKVPAVYSTLYNKSIPGASISGAFNVINKKTNLYYFNAFTNRYEPYDYDGEETLSVEMLVDEYAMKTPVDFGTNSINGVDVTLTTAKSNARDGYPYVGAANTLARIVRSFDGNAMFTLVKDMKVGLTLKDITLDGNKAKGKNSKAKGGIVLANDTCKLTITTGAVLENSKNTGNSGGAAVYIGAKGQAEMNGGTIQNNECTGTACGGAFYVSADRSNGATLTITGTPTITGNTCGENGSGAGIYLHSATNGNGHAKLYLSGNPNFGGPDLYTQDVTENGVEHKKDDIKGESGNFAAGSLTNEENGGKAYSKKRQDIFLTGYQSTDPAESLIITGKITSGAGSIWVWAQESPHYKTLEQFAKLDTSLVKNDNGATVLDTKKISEDDLKSSLEAFRNAREDDYTDAAKVGKYLYGMTRQQDSTRLNVYWYGIEGSARVMLVKVGNIFEALSGVKLSIYTDSTMTKLATGTVLNSSTGKEEDMLLENLTSGYTGSSTPAAGGAFFIGTLPYGTYYVKETSVGSNTDYSVPTNKQHFEFTIDDGGVVKIEGSGTSETKTPVKIVTLTDDT